MAANLSNNSDSMYFLTRDEEGFYRWTYEVDSSENHSLLNLYLLIFGLIVLIPGAILFFMIFGNKGYLSGAGSYLLIWLAVFAGVELLTFLIYKAVEKAQGGVSEMPYLMGPDFIAVHPGTKMAPRAYIQTDFSQVKDITLDKKSDLILLHEVMRVTHVYVPREDLPFVLNYILDRVPQSEKIKKRKEEFGKDLEG